MKPPSLSILHCLAGNQSLHLVCIINTGKQKPIFSPSSPASPQIQLAYTPLLTICGELKDVSYHSALAQDEAAATSALYEKDWN